MTGGTGYTRRDPAARWPARPAPRRRTSTPGSAATRRRSSTCVWVGYPQGEIPLRDIEGVPAVYGGTIPAAIWHDFMAAAMQGSRSRTSFRRRPSRLRPRARRWRSPRPRRPSPSATPSPSERRRPASRPSPSRVPEPERVADARVPATRRARPWLRRCPPRRPERARAAAASTSIAAERPIDAEALGDRVDDHEVGRRLERLDRERRHDRACRVRARSARRTSRSRARRARASTPGPPGPLAGNSRALSLSKPGAVVLDLDPQLRLVGLDGDERRSPRRRACRRSTAPPGRRGRRASRGPRAGRARTAPVNSVWTPVLAPEALQRLAQRRDQAALLQHRRAQPRHQPAEGVGLLVELLADLRRAPRARARCRRP